MNETTIDLMSLTTDPNFLKLTTPVNLTISLADMRQVIQNEENKLADVIDENNKSLSEIIFSQAKPLHIPMALLEMKEIEMTQAEMADMDFSEYTEENFEEWVEGTLMEVDFTWGEVQTWVEEKFSTYLHPVSE